MVRPIHDDVDSEAKLDRINVDENGRFMEAETEREPRGEKKKRAIQLEKLGEALIALKPGQLVRVPMPDDLRVAVVDAQRLRIIAGRAMHGYRRQVQLIGKIMRTVDALPIAAALESILSEGTLASPAFQQAEQWRTRLLAEGDAALEPLLSEQPGFDRTALRQLVRAAQAERKKQATHPQTPSTNQKKLFRMLREVLEPGARFDAADATDDAEEGAHDDALDAADDGDEAAEDEDGDGDGDDDAGALDSDGDVDESPRS